MKSLSLLAIALMVGGVANANDNKPKPAKPASAQEVKLDVAASKVSWVGKKISGSHNGTVGVKEGKFEVKNNTISKGEVVIDLTNIVNEDVKDPGYNQKLVDHLKGEDFFDVAKHPTATFKIESFSEVKNFAPGEPNAKAKGKLTIRGVTKPFEAKLFYTPNGEGFEAKGKLEIDRTQYGLKYNSKKFFDVKALGDKLIEDKFEVDLKLVAKK